MSEIYKPEEIEPKWQAKWADDGLYEADIDPATLLEHNILSC